jgi:transketolase
MSIDYDNSDLIKIASRIRLTVLEMAHRSKSPHVGSCLSCVDVLAHLYFRELSIRPDNHGWQDRDFFLLSKGHAAMALYATLAQRGVIDNKLLDGYMLDSGTLPAHTDRFAAPGIEISAGALGHGLPMAVGMAHGFKLRNKKNRVVVLMGDGESQEGSVWESAMMAPTLCIDNLVAIIDHNNLQGYGRPCEIMHFRPVLDKWRAFGWHAIEADGHDFVELADAFVEARSAGRPAVIVLKTIKGRGVSYMEDELKWHYFIVTDERLEAARKELRHA